MQKNRPIYERRDAGFSLLETLIALAIMSIASLALFQSTTTMLSVSDRAVKTSERALDGALNRRAVSGLLSALVPAWPEETTRAFTGGAQQLQGLSSESLSWQDEALGSGLTHFSLTLTEDARGAMSLRYRDLSQTQARSDDGWILEAGLPRDTQFSYMGLDGVWYPEWPPATPPTTPYFNDALFITMPSLPDAVKLQTAQGAVLSIVAVRAQKSPPLRLDLGRDNAP